MNNNGSGQTDMSGYFNQHHQGMSSWFNNDMPEWVHDPLNHPLQLCPYRGRIWNFCKHGHGKWVFTHTDATHQSSGFLYQKSYRDDDSNSKGWSWQMLGTANDRAYKQNDRGFSPSRSLTPPAHPTSSLLHDRSRSVSFRSTPSFSPKAQLSLYDKIKCLHSWRVRVKVLHCFVCLNRISIMLCSVLAWVW